MSLLFLGLLWSCSKENILTESEREWLKENDHITVALFPYYPPYQFINHDNSIEGIFIEYLDLIEEKTEHKFKRKYYSNWSIELQEAKDKKVDILFEIQETKNRKQYLTFYSKTFESKHVIVSRKNSFKGSKIKDLQNAQIVVPKDYAITENLKRLYPQLSIYEEVNDITCLQKLNAGQYDVFIGPKAVVNYLIKNKNLSNLTIDSETNLTYKPGIAVDKNNKILNSIINKAISDISTTENQNIIERWLFKETKPYYKNSKFIILLVLSVLILLIISIGINFYLGFIVKQRTKELRGAKESSEKDNNLKSAFINNVSHEIRSPMNGIIGFSKLLDEPKITPKEKRKYTDNIIQSCKQLITNMDNILEVSKLQTKQVSLNPEPTDLFDVFATILSLFERKAQNKGIDLILNNTIDKNKRLVVIDKSKLIKTVGGILENSIKFTEKGAILISGSIQNSSLVVSVRDSGIGIPSKDQRILFKSFAKSENQISKKYGGLGLGLTIAKKNTDLMNGELSLSSIENQGTTFRLELPYTKIKQTNNKIVSNEIHIKEQLKEHIILIAEDGDVNFLFLKTILTKIEGYNFSIYRAKNGKEAVSFCKEHKNIDLVLMDIKMPEMNGYQATALIKEIEPKLPVIAQTAYSTKEDIQNAYAAGCDDFISKPVDPKILKPILQKYLVAKY